MSSNFFDKDKKQKQLKKERKDAVSVLVQRCIETERQGYTWKSFLTGAAGMRLLKKARMSREEFTIYLYEKRRMGENEQTPQRERVVVAVPSPTPNFFKILDLLDNIENVTLKDAEKRILHVLQKYSTLTRTVLQEKTGIPERSLQRFVHRLSDLGILRVCRSSLLVIELNPVFFDLLTLSGSHCGYDLGVIRRKISHSLLQPHNCCNDQDLCNTPHDPCSLEDEGGEELGQRMKYQHPKNRKLGNANRHPSCELPVFR